MKRACAEVYIRGRLNRVFPLTNSLDGARAGRQIVRVRRLLQDSLLPGEAKKVFIIVSFFKLVFYRNSA